MGGGGGGGKSATICTEHHHQCTIRTMVPRLWAGSSVHPLVWLVCVSAVTVVEEWLCVVCWVGVGWACVGIGCACCAL